MAVDIFKHQMDDETLQGVRAFTCLWGWFATIHGKEATSALHTRMEM